MGDPLHRRKETHSQDRSCPSSGAGRLRGVGPEARRRSRMCAERRDCSPARDGHGTETEDLTAAQLCPGPSDFWPLPHLPMPLSALLIPYQGPSALPPSFLEKPKWGSGLRSGCGQGQARPSSPGEVSALRGTAGLQDGSSAWGGGGTRRPLPSTPLLLGAV